MAKNRGGEGITGVSSGAGDGDRDGDGGGGCR